jgi:Holliday junction resolvasome RuvABC endonuclease subunit
VANRVAGEVGVSLVVLGLDPGFAALGWALVDVDYPLVHNMGVLRTRKEVARARVYAVEDNVRRLREIIINLDALCVGHGVRAIAAEAMSFPRSASVAAKVALVWGAVVTLAEKHGLPLLQCTPQQLKRWASGNHSASKEDVAFEVRRRCGNDCAMPLDSIPKGLHEHAYDAAAVALTCATADIVRAMRAA